MDEFYIKINHKTLQEFEYWRELNLNKYVTPKDKTAVVLSYNTMSGYRYYLKLLNTDETVKVLQDEIVNLNKRIDQLFNEKMELNEKKKKKSWF